VVSVIMTDHVGKDQVAKAVRRCESTMQKGVAENTHRTANLHADSGLSLQTTSCAKRTTRVRSTVADRSGYEKKPGELRA